MTDLLVYLNCREPRSFQIRSRSSTKTPGSISSNQSLVIHTLHLDLTSFKERIVATQSSLSTESRWCKWDSRRSTIVQRVARTRRSAISNPRISHVVNVQIRSRHGISHWILVLRVCYLPNMIIVRRVRCLFRCMTVDHGCRR